MQLYLKDGFILRKAERKLPEVGTLTYVLYEERGLRGEPTEYGIEICLRTTRGEETERIRSITTSRAFATRLFRALILGEVTPCTLTDIVLDAISQ
ncbi:MAG: hypothetical protein J6D21_09665 [Clostridia bacterium]|nr:hypothetical protein [Clostridia bacterium]